MKAIVKGAKEKGKKQPRKVLEHLQSQLRELAERVEKHKRPTPNPAASTRAVDGWGHQHAVWGIFWVVPKH